MEGRLAPPLQEDANYRSEHLKSAVSAHLRDELTSSVHAQSDVLLPIEQGESFKAGIYDTKKGRRGGPWVTTWRFWPGPTTSWAGYSSATAASGKLIKRMLASLTTLVSQRLFVGRARTPEFFPSSGIISMLSAKTLGLIFV